MDCRADYVKWGIAAVVVAFALNAAAARQPGYLLTTSSTAIPGSFHNVCISFTGVATEMMVELEIRNAKGSAERIPYKGNTVKLPEKGGCYAMHLPVSISPDVVELTMKATSLDDTDIIFTGMALLKVFKKAVDFTFIQTDKPVYQPSETVRIRIVTLRYDMTPVFKGTQNISIQNPLGFDIERWEHVSLAMGIVDLNMTLVAEPLFGVYTILCTIGGRIERANFTVLKYVLPRIEIIQKPPEYFVKGTTHLTGEICTKYTFASNYSLSTSKLLLTATFSLVKVTNDTHVKESESKPFVLLKEMAGCYTYEVASENLGIDWSRLDIDELRLLVKSKVMEHGTGVETIGKDSLIKLSESNASLQIICDDTYKPDIPYEFKVKLHLRNKNILQQQRISVEFDDNYSPIVRLSQETKEDGFAFFTTKLGKEMLPFQMHACCANHSVCGCTEEKHVTSWFSHSGRFLKLRTPRDGSALLCNREAKIEYYYTTTATGELVEMNEQVISSTNVVHFNKSTVTFQPKENITSAIESKTEPCTITSSATLSTKVSFLGSASLSLIVTPAMSPSAKLLVFYISPEGELVSDMIDIVVTECLSNTVKLSFSKSQVRPGRSIFLNISAAAGSFCTYGVIDRSVDLLGNRKILDISQIFGMSKAPFQTEKDWLERLQNYTNFHSRCQAYTDDGAARNGYVEKLTDAGYVFLAGKTVVLTNLKLNTGQCYCLKRTAVRRLKLHSPVENQDTEFNGAEYKPSVEIRNYFPETWLWDSVRINESGIAYVTTNAPHSMTSWRGKVMCVQSSHGFGISPTASLITFQRFFLRASLPYSAIRGESVPIVVKIHNYFSECFTINVSIVQSSEFTTLRASAAAVCVCGGKIASHLFQLVPRTVGKVNITITANQLVAATNHTCSNTSNESTIFGIRDAVQKILLVEPEGRRQEYVRSAYICQTKGSPKNWTLPLEQLTDIVSQSTRGSVSVVGDVLGHTIGNLNTLITLPDGCGEQRMRTFASSVFSLQYLEATGQLTESMRESAVSALKQGYQQQWSHRCPNGAFSFYTSNYQYCSSNVWLTAFIVKCFAHARPYIPISEDALKDSLAFLRGSQLPDGCFTQSGDGRDSRLSAGIWHDSPTKQRTRLTAFTAIALLEAGVEKQNAIVTRALNCLESSSATDEYSLALTVYAYSLHDVSSERRESAMTALRKAASRSGRDMFGATESYVHWNADRESMSVEATSYALLATLQQPSVIDTALPIVRWLTSKRNGHGGFISTQDTVMAVQALAAFTKATFANAAPTDMMIRSMNPYFTKVFVVNRSNRLVVQSGDITTIQSSNLTFEVSGEGCIVLQAKIVYNVRSTSTKTDYFETIVTPYVQEKLGTLDNCTARQLHICSKYTRRDEDSSNMAILEIMMVSGWTPDTNSLDLLQANASIGMARYEISNQMVWLHFTQIPKSPLCFSINAKLTHKFQGAEPGHVATYEYYAPARRHETTFTMNECPTTLTDIDRLETPENDDPDSDPEHNEEECPTCYEPRQLSILCGHRHVFRSRRRLSDERDKRIEITGDYKAPTSQFQRLSVTPLLGEGCECDPLDYADNSLEFVIAYTRRLRTTRTSTTLNLYSKQIYIFATSDELQNRLANVLQNCRN